MRMKHPPKKQTIAFTQTRSSRKGGILVLSALMLIGMFAFTAFSIDLGYVSLVRSQMQTAADSAALAAAVDIPMAWGAGASLTADEMASAARNIARQVASQNKMAAQPGTFVDPQRDIRFGFYSYDDDIHDFVQTWNEPPFNMVEVTVRRNVRGGNQDGPLDLFFGPIIGHESVDLQATAAVALVAGNGIRIDPNNPTIAEVIPITVDEETWESVVNGTGGTDDYHFDIDTGQISNNRDDGVREFDMYPISDGSVPAGNRGTVDFGHSGNSTDDIKRQILYGLNLNDLSYFGGEINFDNGPLQINGDTGISAGFEAQLKQIIGQPRCIPLFTEVSGPGNNAVYTITRLVGIRILDVKLTGAKKYVVVQPAPFVDETVIRSSTTVVESDSIFAPAVLIR